MIDALSSQHRVPPQAILDQKGGQAAAAASFRKSLLLEPIHHTPRQGHVQPFRIRGLRHLSRCELQ